MKDAASIIRRSAALGAVLVLAACGDSATGPGTAFDVRAAVRRAETVSSAAGSNPDVVGSLELVSETLGGSSALPSVAGFFAGGALQPTLDSAAVRAMAEEFGRTEGTAASGPRPRASLLVPDSLMGVTFTWNPDAGAYEIDPSRTDAPANGVRFLYYAVDPATGRPATPLNELGRIDLTDESVSSGDLTLGVQVVDTHGTGDVTLADYTVGGSITVAGDTRLSADAQGYFSDGTDRLDFTLTQEVDLPAGSSTVTGTTRYELSSGGVTLVLDSEGSFDLDTGAATSASLSLAVSDGSDTATLDLAVAGDGSLDGHVDYLGTPVILVGGTADQPTFTGADGSTLSSDQVQALRDLLGAIDSISGFARAILGVFGGGA